jgi:hypothetical protein
MQNQTANGGGQQRVIPPWGTSVHRNGIWQGINLLNLASSIFLYYTIGDVHTVEFQDDYESDGAHNTFFSDLKKQCKRRVDHLRRLPMTEQNVREIETVRKHNIYCFLKHVRYLAMFLQEAVEFGFKALSPKDNTRLLRMLRSLSENESYQHPFVVQSAYSFIFWEFEHILEVYITSWEHPMTKLESLEEMITLRLNSRLDITAIPAAMTQPVDVSSADGMVEIEQSLEHLEFYGPEVPATPPRIYDAGSNAPRGHFRSPTS